MERRTIFKMSVRAVEKFHQYLINVACVVRVSILCSVAVAMPRCKEEGVEDAGHNSQRKYVQIAGTIHGYAFIVGVEKTLPTINVMSASTLGLEDLNKIEKIDLF